jgi:RNA polymerase sigma-32 factor
MRTTQENDTGHYHYLQTLAHFEPLAADEERALAERYTQHQDHDAARMLVESHLRFVVKVANGFRGYGIPVSELVGEGNIGLLEAVSRFDPTRGIRFVSYAVYWIRAFMLAYIMRQWSVVRLSGAARRTRLFFRLMRERARLTAALGDSLSPEAMESVLAARFETSREHVRDMTATLDHRDLSLDAPIGSGDGSVTLLEYLNDGGDGQENELAKVEHRHAVRAKLRALEPSLSPRERYILSHRLYTDEPKTLAEVGKRFRVSRERVRQIEQQMLRRLRRELADLAA